MPKIQEALRCFEEASGAKVNIGKSRALAIGPWDTSVWSMDIPYHTEAKHMGFHIMSKLQESANKSWTITETNSLSYSMEKIGEAPVSEAN